MNQNDPTAEMTVEQVSHRWPQTIPVFRHFVEACVGCSLAPFCTLHEAAEEFDLPVETLLDELSKVIGGESQKDS